MKTSNPQSELPLFRVAQADPNIEFLMGLLGDGAWMLSTEIVRVVQARTGAGWSTTKVNALAAAACPQIISGQLGYKLTKHATADEVNHFCNQMESRGKEMIARAEKTRRFAHQLFG